MDEVFPLLLGPLGQGIVLLEVIDLLLEICAFLVEVEEVRNECVGKDFTALGLERGKQLFGATS